MPAFRLISFRICPWVQRAAIVLREKGVSFDLVHIEPGNRPDWLAAISPHGKVPVLQIDEHTALFESNAIAEYLDDVIEPRLHPDDPVARAFNRAWTDNIATYAAALTAVVGATDESAYEKARTALHGADGKLERALAGEGPYFNGDRYSLVDAAYAPFLQRHLLIDAIADVPSLRDFPRLARWAEALVARPSTHSFPPDEFETLYRQNLAKRGSWLLQLADRAVPEPLTA